MTKKTTATVVVNEEGRNVGVVVENPGGGYSLYDNVVASGSSRTELLNLLSFMTDSYDDVPAPSVETPDWISGG